MAPSSLTARYPATETSAVNELVKDVVNRVTSKPEFGEQTSAIILYCINGGFSILLVLLGGLFAGLTLAFMGQDRTTLQVIAGSGTAKEQLDAKKVLAVLQRGRHWVLVSLLLGNVITNETLPIVLDQDVRGGWFAVLASTMLIVIFGEIIPQSVCAKYGLAVGAWSSRYVLWVMYGLFPVAYPIAKLLDLLLGANHGIFFNRAGLKVLVILHERSPFSLTERLSREEVTVISTVLDLKEKPTSSIMTPLAKLFTLSNEASINEMTRYNILASGHTIIPIHQQGHPRSFVGVLSVKSLVALKSEKEITVGQLSLDILPVVRPEASCQELFHVFRDPNIKMVLVTERGSRHGEPLGIVTARDVMTEVFGDHVAFKEELEY